MPTARIQSAAGVIDGVLYVVGGLDSASISDLATVEAYDPVTNTWSTMDPMPAARAMPASAVINGRLYVAGGYIYDDNGDFGGSVSTLEVFTPSDPVVSVDVDIDIKPGSDPNSINLGSNGVLPVAVLTTDEFDAQEVNEETVLFGDPVLMDPDIGTGIPVDPIRSCVEDVDGDGDDDLLLFFSVPELAEFGALDADSTESLLIGETFDGVPIFGLDSVRIVPPKGKGKSGK